MSQSRPTLTRTACAQALSLTQRAARGCSHGRGAGGGSPGLTDGCCLFFRPRGCSLARTPGRRAPWLSFSSGTRPAPRGPSHRPRITHELWALGWPCHRGVLDSHPKTKASAPPSGLHPFSSGQPAPQAQPEEGPGLLPPGSRSPPVPCVTAGRRPWRCSMGHTTCCPARSSPWLLPQRCPSVPTLTHAPSAHTRMH